MLSVRAAAQSVAVIAVAAVALSACGSRTNHFSGNGYAFDYPGNWKPRTNLTFDATTGAGALSKEAVGLDDVNLAVVLTTRTDSPITRQNLPQLEVQATNDIHEVAARGGGVVTGGPHSVTIGGLPGFQFELSGIHVGSARVDGRLILAFQGRIEYLLLCQHTAQEADQVESACDQIVRTFRATRG
jgi:hypothetical protein